MLLLTTPTGAVELRLQRWTVEGAARLVPGIARHYVLVGHTAADWPLYSHRAVTVPARPVMRGEASGDSDACLEPWHVIFLVVSAMLAAGQRQWLLIRQSASLHHMHSPACRRSSRSAHTLAVALGLATFRLSDLELLALADSATNPPDNIGGTVVGHHVLAMIPETTTPRDVCFFRVKHCPGREDC